MRLLSLTLLTLAVVSCAPQTDPAPPKEITAATSPVRAEQYPGNNEPLPAEGTLPTSKSLHAIRAQKAEVAGVTLTYLSFDTRTHTLAVVDQATVGSEFQSAAAVTRAKGALATINGGFFTPEGQPLGLVYQNGKKSGSLNTASSLGSGVVYVDEKLAQPVIARRATFQGWLKDPAFNPKEVLQTGPFLVEDGRAVSGLSNDQARVRSLLLWDGEHHFAIAQCAPISLRNLGGALAKQPLSGFKVQVALNLDGGRSADLNISSKVPGGPINLRTWLNKPVRNYVIVKPQ